MHTFHALTQSQAQEEHEAAQSREVEWEREQAVRREIVRSWKERQEMVRRNAAGDLTFVMCVCVCVCSDL
jgi:hypothetical protein